MTDSLPHKPTYNGRPSAVLHRFYRGVTFQAIILGLVSFTQPGIWDALNNLGAGGQASPYVVNAANAITFSIMVLSCASFAVIGNRYSLKWVIVFGTLGYVPYYAALYCNTVYGTQWFLIFGAVTCGFSAAALWTAEGALMVGYPEASRRGTCVAIWLSLNKIGRLIAGGIELGINAGGDKAGSVTPSTYLVLVGLSCAGLPLSLLLSPPNKLIRRDGTKPIFTSRNTPIRKGFKDFWAVLRTRRVYLMIPIFITAQWGQTYNGNYLAEYFSVRARALGALLVTVVGIIVNWTVGLILDSNRLRRSIRARSIWVFVAAAYIASWIYQLVTQADNQRHHSDFDWTTPGFARAVFPYIVYRIAYEAAGTWMYWMIGTHDAELDTLALTASVLRAGESLGSTFSYAVGASASASLMDNLITAAVVWFAAVPATTYCAWHITDSTPSQAVERASDDGDGEEEVDVSISKKVDVKEQSV